MPPPAHDWLMNMMKSLSLLILRARVCVRAFNYDDLLVSLVMVTWGIAGLSVKVVLEPGLVFRRYKEKIRLILSLV